MTDPNVLEFVARLTELQLKSDPRASVVDVSRGLLENLATENSPASNLGYAQIIADLKSEHRASDEPAVVNRDAAFLVAPSPKSPDQIGEVYDPMISVGELPKFESLPSVFGTTDYSAIRLNDETAAISNEHYFDLLAIRDECKSLREDKAKLEAMMIESARRHVAIEELAKHGVYIHATGSSVFVSATDINESGDSLTECMERAVEKLALLKKEKDAITSVAEIADATIDQEIASELNLELEPNVILGIGVVADEQLSTVEPDAPQQATEEDANDVW